MAEVPEVSASSPVELLAAGRRHLAVRDYSSAVETLAKACEHLAKDHGDVADECAEAYLWYGKALLGLSREENGVLGDGVPGANEEDDNEDENAENNENAAKEESGEVAKDNGDVQKSEAESTTKEEPGSSSAVKPEESGEPAKPEESTEPAEPAEPKESAEPSGIADDKPGTSNGEANDESVVNLENDDDVDNLQLAWEMLDLARSILQKRVETGGDSARTLLAEVHLALGEVALESETYDKAVIDMVSCLDIQKELYKSDDRRIAETHYHIGIANSLASNFEDAITHFKNAANILETRIKTLENPSTITDETAKKHSNSDPFYTVEGEIKELKELLPEIQEKIQDMMDYKAETIKRVRETLFSSNGEVSSNGAGSSTSAPKPAASDISHLIKRKRKNSEEETPAPKRVNS